MPDVAPASPSQLDQARLSTPEGLPAALEASGNVQKGDTSGVEQVERGLVDESEGQSGTPPETSTQVSPSQVHNHSIVPPIKALSAGLLDGTPLAQPVMTRPETGPPTQIIAPSPSRPTTQAAILSVIQAPSPAPSQPSSVGQPASPAPPAPDGLAPSAPSPAPPTPSPAPQEPTATSSITAPHVPGPATSPPPPEGAAKPAAPVAKKFTSSLSVNKQFLAREAEKAKLKATEKAKQTVAAKVALAPPNPNGESKSFKPLAAPLTGR